MIKILKGDIFDSQAQTLVNTVNCVGIMGKGLALKFKKRFPDMFQDYQTICKKEELKLGQPYLYKSLIPPWILNFPTKGHWRAVSRVEDIVKGLEYLIEHYKEWGITSLAIPPLGCGQGQLEWDTVGPILTHYLSLMDIPVEIYAPYEIPEAKIQLDFFKKEIKNNLRSSGLVKS
ncbi:MAG TPA: macro domain-containing protein [Candidatus Eremiobacteraeota bacterium]|nr:MAG: Macro domain protein [bacterium ADurb.Bin363]HPZ08876.1 macro domain-containing protein [Candidatus Eremiobacteraeota bacterium]